MARFREYDVKIDNLTTLVQQLLQKGQDATSQNQELQQRLQEESAAAATAKLVPVLVDTGSTNGTLVNGRKASKRKPILLENDVVLVFGGKKSDLAYKVEIKEMVSQESAGHSSSTSKSKKSKR